MNYKVNKEVHIQHWGKIPYKEAWEKQEQLFNCTIETKINNRSIVNEDQKPTSNYLIFCEHPNVYTQGKSGDEKNLLLNQKEMAKKGIDYFKINRGGDITYHGLGQVVVYPILDLDNFFTDIHRYLRLLEESVILTLKEFGIKGERVGQYTGVWIDANTPRARKICAMGVRSSRWVTMHGLALNVNPDLHYFDHIIPCGIDDKAVTSMKHELKQEIDTGSVETTLQKHLAQLFQMKSI